jgi:cell wall-associated NlpC family hydrolase
MSDHVGTLGRGGVVIAMSSGLVATMGLPASAADHATGQDAAVPATAPIAVQPALALQSGLMAAPSALDATAAPLTAPAAATVSYSSSAFTAVPKAVPHHAVSTTAGTVQGSTAHAASLAASFGSAKGSSVLAVAARYVGVPYVYGGTTPSGWDCSGAMRYIFNQVGVSLPRTANEQMQFSKRISRSEAKPGDLVFFTSGGAAYHVGIYAGGNMMYDAQRTGKSFTYRAIYTSAVSFGRVL